MLNEKDFNRHPCFNVQAKGQYGRVHLPVAPKCNIQCNYCNRKYDCVNESRPGVTSTLLSPDQALVYMGKVLEKEPRISVAGTPPTITGTGPHVASSKLETIPGWIDLRYPAALLDLSSAKLTVSEGARIVRFQPRVDRSVFELQADGPGEYWLEFSVADVLGRPVKERWPLRVLP